MSRGVREKAVMMVNDDSPSEPIEDRLVIAGFFGGVA